MSVDEKDAIQQNQSDCPPTYSQVPIEAAWTECSYLLTLLFLWIDSLDPSPAEKSTSWWLRISSAYSLIPLPLWSRPSLFPSDSSSDPSMPSGFTSPRMYLALWFGKWREACVAACAFKTPQSWWVVVHQPLWRNVLRNSLAHHTFIFQKRKCLLIFWNFFMSWLRF